MPGDSIWKQPIVCPRSEQGGGGRVGVGQVVEVHSDAAPLLDAAGGLGHYRERALPEQVDLHQPDRLDALHLVLRHHDALGAVLQGGVPGERPVADDQAAQVDAEVAHVAVDLQRRPDHGAPGLAVDGEAGHLRKHAYRLLDAGGAVVGQQLAEGADLVERQAHHAPDVAECRACPQRRVRGDHRHAPGAIAGIDVIDDVVAAAPAEVDVDVRHVGAELVEEALEVEVELQRADGADAQAVADDAVGGRAAPDVGDALALGELDDVAHDQEVVAEVELGDDGQFALEAFAHGAA